MIVHGCETHENLLRPTRGELRHGPLFGAFFMHTYANRVELSVAWPKVPSSGLLPFELGHELQRPVQRGTGGA
jgi:hypothetical protein